VIEGGHLVEVGSTRVVYHLYQAAEFNSGFALRGAHTLFFAEHGDVRESFARADGGGDDGTRVFAFGQNDALRVGGSALSDALENDISK